MFDRRNRPSPELVLETKTRILQLISAFGDIARVDDPEHHKFGFELAQALEALSEFSAAEIARTCRCSPATFLRWKLGLIHNPHHAHVAGLFEGLQTIADKTIEKLHSDEEL